MPNSPKIVPALGNITKNFSEAFPEIKSLNVTITEEMGGIRNGPCSRSCTEKNLLDALDQVGRYKCHNRECSGEGFRICKILHSMIKEEAVHNDMDEWKRALCEGKIAPHKDCYNSFKLEINIEYK